MPTIATDVFTINGVISTDKTVTENMNTLSTAAGAWATFDVHTGKWSVIINQAGTSIASFNDSNIIGGISVSGTGINELYNAVTIEFPHKDLRDQRDYIDLEIATADWYPNELPNRLNISIDCINNPVQAQMIAARELKQSRVNTIIEFTTDFSKLELKAGDLIDVTASMYGYTNKMFRIIKVVEDDRDDGQLVFNITALEYDSSVYDMTGLVRKERNKKTGIVPKAQNTAIQTSDAVATAQQASTGYANQAAATALLGLINAITGNASVLGSLGNALTASGTVGTASNLDGLTDVVVSSPSIGQALAYNGTQWVNTNIQGTGTGAGNMYSISSDLINGAVHDRTTDGESKFIGAPIPITLSIPGTYVLQVTFDQNSGDAKGRDSDSIGVAVDVSTNNVLNSPSYIATANSGGAGMWYWTDFNVACRFTITQPFTGYLKFSTYIPTTYSVAGTNYTNTTSRTEVDVFYNLYQLVTTGGVATDLDSLSDVTITTPTSGQVLTYNGTNWVNGTAGGGGGSGYTPTYQEITSSTTWTKPTGASFIRVEVIGGGGGGGSGARYAVGTSRSGGGGGSGGVRHEQIFLASAITSPVTITIGQGGTGGNAVTTDTTNGNPGNNGTETSFGTYLTSGIAGGGAGGVSGSSSSGGAVSFKGVGIVNVGGGGGGGAGQGVAGGSAVNGGAGGGGGGGANTFSGTDATSTSGGAGGINRITATAAPTTPNSGVQGIDGATAGQGGDGGGFAGSTSLGRFGGNGAFPGGGGGGGSCSANGYNSGRGGNGANGVVRIWTW